MDAIALWSGAMHRSRIGLPATLLVAFLAAPHLTLAAVTGDLDQDGDVDFDDVDTFRQCLGAVEKPGCEEADFNGDGAVSVRDVSFLRDAFLDYHASLITPGDFDTDGDIDLADFLDLVRCFTGPNRTVSLDCLAADLDLDLDVDLADLIVFQTVFTGSVGGPPRQCC